VTASAAPREAASIPIAAKTFRTTRIFGLLRRGSPDDVGAMLDVGAVLAKSI
jgi:hypothetical protein